MHKELADIIYFHLLNDLSRALIIAEFFNWSIEGRTMH